MATSLVSTGVQFPDSTIQTTAASASPMVLLATVNATSGTYVTFNGYFTSAYDNYLVMGSNFAVDDTWTSRNFGAQVAVASTFQTSDYCFTGLHINSSTSQVNGYSVSSNNRIDFGPYSSYFRSMGISLYIFNPLSNLMTPISYTITGRTSGNVTLYASGSGMYQGSTSAISGIRFYWSNGEFQSGKFQLYGLKNS